MSQKLAAYDATTGAITGLYDSVDSPAPKGASVIDLTDSQWQACISTPGYTVKGGVLFAPAPPTAAQQLAQAQAVQVLSLEAAYVKAITTDVAFTTAAGVSKTYQADSASQTVLAQATQGYVLAGAVPAGFYWVASDNTKVAFTLADLKGLYAAMLAQGWTAFQHLQAQKAAVAAATSIATAQAITW